MSQISCTVKATDSNNLSIIIENVPYRIDSVTGEKLFSPETLENLQTTIWGSISVNKDSELDYMI